MADDRRNQPTSRSPEEWRLIRLGHAPEEAKQIISQREARFKAEHGEDLKQRIADQLVDDPNISLDAANRLAKLLAERGAQPGNLDWRDHRGLPDEAIEKAFAADEAKHQQELGGTKVLKADWRDTAHEILDRRPPSGPTEGNSQPVAPQPPTPGLNQQLRLTADQIFHRFNDPALQARYLQQERRRDRETKSASPILETPSTVLARGNLPTEKARESGLMSDFVKSETKKKVAEEEEARINDPNRSPGRGGRGR